MTVRYFGSQVVKDRDRKVDESRGGFVLTGAATLPTTIGRAISPIGDSDPRRRGTSLEKTGRSSLRKTIVDGLRLRKQRSTGDIQVTCHLLSPVHAHWRRRLL